MVECNFEQVAPLNTGTTSPTMPSLVFCKDTCVLVFVSQDTRIAGNCSSTFWETSGKKAHISLLTLSLLFYSSGKKKWER